MRQRPPIIEPIEADVFVASAMREFTADVRLAELALARATTDPVRTMAMHINDDCARALRDIERIATRKNFPLGEPSDTDQGWLLQRMRDMPGVDFDYAYSDRIAIHHWLEISLLKRGLTLQSPEMSALASRLLAVVEARAKLGHHLSEGLDFLRAAKRVVNDFVPAPARVDTH
jgi:predicted outer membrane protein